MVTPAQLAALQSYVSATARFMTCAEGERSHAARVFIDARTNLEAAFGKPLPQPSAMPDIL